MKNDLSYEKAFERLNAVVDEMSSPSVPLEKLMKLYEEGMELARHCEKLLTGYEKRLQSFARQSVLNEAALLDTDESEEE